MIKLDDTYEKTYSLNKIQDYKESDDDSFLDQKFLDKIKLLELSNIIDKWEKEILFAPNGFYSFKGKNIENKSKEFISELKSFIDSKIEEIHFNSDKSREAAFIIKNLKIENIYNEMYKYEKLQIKDWNIQVLTDSLNSAKQKAVLYKDNLEVIEKSLKNAIAVFSLFAKQEHWSEKMLKQQKKVYISEFFKEIIDSFIEEKNPCCSIYYEKFGKYLIIDNIEEYEKNIMYLKNEIIAYNWAKELFSYNLSETENEKEISNLNNENLENSVRKVLNILKRQKNMQECTEKDLNNEKNWNNIIKILDTEPDKALLYIDNNEKNEDKKSQKEYIMKILKDGFINTNESEFVNLLEEMFENFEKFKKKNINSYRNILSKEDFEIFSEFKKFSENDFCIYKSDFNYIKNKLESLKIKTVNQIYWIFKIYFIETKRKFVNKENYNIDSVNKLIDGILIRFSKNNLNEKSKNSSKISDKVSK